jgi:hypothetical protein
MDFLIVRKSKHLKDEYHLIFKLIIFLKSRNQVARVYRE